MHRKETRKYLENKWTKLAEAKSSPLDVAFCGEALVSDRWSMYRRKKGEEGEEEEFGIDWAVCPPAPLPLVRYFC